MINDLRVPGVSIWKYVDDRTVAEVVARNNHSNAQAAVNSLVE